MWRETLEKTLDFNLHPKQADVWTDATRFRIVVAGRRWGKSRLAVMECVKHALEGEKDVFYVAPTFQQARDIAWDMLCDMCRPVTKAVRSQEGCVELINGRKIYIKGSDRPDTMRGVGLCFVVIDEYADMKPGVWDTILRPALADVRGRALFIGTPKGRNHFFELVEKANNDKTGMWSVWQFTSLDNPYIAPEEIEAARLEMSSMQFKQEFMASFETGSSDVFNDEWLQYMKDEPKWEGEWFVAVDLAGFEQVKGTDLSARQKRLDRSAIAVVKVCKQGWFIKTIKAGRWDVRETALRILREAQKVNAKVIGIEKGALKAAVMPYLYDTMRRLSFFPRIEDTTHGNQKKIQRIVWALQGRFEHGRMFFQVGDWNKEFEDEYRNFPSSQVHDDMLDALSYIDQIAQVIYFDQQDMDEISTPYKPMDWVTGY